MEESVEQSAIEQLSWHAKNIESHDNHIAIAKEERRKALSKFEETLRVYLPAVMTVQGVAHGQFLKSSSGTRIPVVLNTDNGNNFGPDEFHISSVDDGQVLLSDPTEPSNRYGLLVAIDAIEFVVNHNENTM